MCYLKIAQRVEIKLALKLFIHPERALALDVNGSKQQMWFYLLLTLKTIKD